MTARFICLFAAVTLLVSGCSHSSQDLADQGRELMVAGDYTGAAAVFEQVLERQDFSPLFAAKIHRMAAEADFRLGRNAASERHLTAAMDLDPQDPVAPFNLASLMLQTGDSARALDLARVAVSRDSLDLDNWRLLARAAVLAGKPDASADALYTAARIDSTQFDIWSNLGTLLLDRNRMDAAREALLRAAACPDAEAEALRNMAELARKKGETALAEMLRNKAANAGDRKKEPADNIHR